MFMNAQVMTLIDPPPVTYTPLHEEIRFKLLVSGQTRLHRRRPALCVSVLKALAVRP